MAQGQRISEDCIHCGLCTKECAFLRKYGLDLQGLEASPGLAYHCFMCSCCTRACPRGIDGRAIALKLRRLAVASNGGKVAEKGYGALIAEKRDYIFRNQKRAHKKSVLYPGCNFPSFFPRTTEYLVKLMGDAADMGVLYDCCGKPVAELGMARDEARGLEQLKERLVSLGIEELVTLCPNCYHFLKPRLDIPVVSIYSRLAELGLGSRIEEPVRLFVPCPDKEGLELQRTLLPFIAGEWENIAGIQCCGLGGCAAGKEEELSASFAVELKGRNYPVVYTYCASCAGKLSRGGVANVRHVLTDILGTGERPELSFKSVWNRARHRFG